MTDATTTRHQIEAAIWFRQSTGEWVLELSGALDNTSFSCRHTEPASTRLAHVAGLPSRYAQLERLEAAVAGVRAAELALRSQGGAAGPDAPALFAQLGAAVDLMERETGGGHASEDSEGGALAQACVPAWDGGSVIQLSETESDMMRLVETLSAQNVALRAAGAQLPEDPGQSVQIDQDLIDDALAKVVELGTVGAMKWLVGAIRGRKPAVTADTLLHALRPFADAYAPIAQHEKPQTDPALRAFLDSNTITPCVTIGNFRLAYEAVAAADAACTCPAQVTSESIARTIFDVFRPNRWTAAEWDNAEVIGKGNAVRSQYRAAGKAVLALLASASAPAGCDDRSGRA